MEEAKKIAQQSLHSIDAYHKEFKRKAWDTRQELELLVDLSL